MKENAKLLVPGKISVGFQKREGTYTGKLAYVIYTDAKGVLRKEKSWQSWRDHKIKPQEFDNEPTEGFVLNKGVGGKRCSSGWDVRNEYIRVYDPRDFEFEISVANLLLILRECDCSRGKGLEGKFVYSWDGAELVLLPVSCQDYKDAVTYTGLQTTKVKAKDLVPGATYVTRSNTQLVYVGKMDWHYMPSPAGWVGGNKRHLLSEKRFIFHDGEDFVTRASVSFIAGVKTDVPVANYADLVSQYNETAMSSPVVRLFLKEKTAKDIKKESGRGPVWHYEKPDMPGVFVEVMSKGEYYDNGQFHTTHRWIDKGTYCEESAHLFAKNPDASKAANTRMGYHRSCYGYMETTWVEPTNMNLWAELANGNKVQIGYNTFQTK